MGGHDPFVTGDGTLLQIASGQGESAEVDVLEDKSYLLHEAHGFIVFAPTALDGAITVEVSRSVSPREWRTLVRNNGNAWGIGAGEAQPIQVHGFRFFRLASDNAGGETADRDFYISPIHEAGGG